MIQGDIILVPFPFTDLSSQKTRPALVISKIQKGEDIIVLAITSKKSVPSVQIETHDLKEGQLPVTSFVRYNKVVTLHKSLIKRVVGHLKTDITSQVLRKFKGLF